MIATKNPEKVKIGTLLVSEGHITQSQLDEALSCQKNSRQYVPLGELCVRLGFLSETDMSRILKTNKYKMYFGDLLVNMSLITPSQLAGVLEKQKASGRKIGELLAEMGLISEEQLAQALCIQLGMPKIIPDVNLIDRDLALEVNEQFLRRVEAVPAFRKDKIVTVIMSDPLSESIIDDFKKIFGCEVEPAIGTRSAIHNLLDELFQKIEYRTGRDKEADKIKDLVIGNIDYSNDRRDNAVNIVNYIISSAISEGASDIHIEPQSGILRVRYRIDGMLLHKTDLPKEMGPSLVSRIKVMCGMDISEKRRHQDGRIEARILDKEIDLRVSVYASVYGENVVIRILNRQTTLIDLNKIGFSPFHITRYKKMLDYPAGVILVVGPTGSGKTTTLYASLNYLNKLDKMIITVEDPVEYTIDGVVQGKLDTKLNLTYSDFLKAMMRQDPDVIMVGEIRDAVAAEATIQAALTGHHVFSTFHTDDTTGALLRLMDMGIETFLISSTVVSVIAQRLVRTLCPNCKQAYIPDKKSFESFNIKKIDPAKFTFYQPKGCVHCHNTGFKGRTAIHEILVVNDAIRHAILSRKTSSQIRDVARQTAQLVSMREDGFYKASRGITTLEEILRVVYHNEGDEMTGRTADEIVAILDLTDDNKFNLASNLKETMPPGGSARISDISSVDSLPDGDIYRTRFESEAISSELDRIKIFFDNYRSVQERAGKEISPELLHEFIDFVVYYSNYYQITKGADFIEFIIKIVEEEPKIFVQFPEPNTEDPASVKKELSRRSMEFLR
jgi:type IV pilus assembly protein PilB